MHRATPADTLHRSYDAGGARTIIDQVDDNPLMQEMAGNFMKGESRKEIEAPQNYGFTSVVRDATKGSDGQINECAEGFINYLGGNRSFPICAVMDDRRYRLKQLQKGDVAMFDYLQHQLHFNNDGIFMTGRTDKKVKLQLAPPPQQQQSGGGSSGGATGGSSGGAQSSGDQKTLKGQTKRYTQTGKQYLQMTSGSTDLVHDQIINYKTGQHIFAPPDSGGATARDGNPLVKILGDKFTHGFGTFTKQVTAATPTLPQHLTTKAYVDALFGSGGGAPGTPGSGIVGSTSPPMNIDTNGHLTLQYKAPLYLDASNVLGVQNILLDGGNF
jgi:phage gp45-like